MKATTKRLVGILLAMAMVLAMLPMAVFAETATTIYVQPNENWLKDGARFAAYFYGNGDTWVDVLDTDGDGLYELNIPQDGNAYAIVIFCRMNPGNTANNWDNKWNQTADLTVPSDNKVVYVVDGWDKGNGQWIEKGGEIEEVEVVYYLRGTLSSWDSTETALTNNGDGTYSITIALAAGSYEYKISDAGWGTSFPAGNNATLTVYSDCDVTFVLNADGSITVTGDGLNGEPLPEPVYEYYVAGSAGLCGVEWDPAYEANKMSETEPGIYEQSYIVDAGEYEFKITTGSWETPSYGDGNANYKITVKNASYVTISFNTETGVATYEMTELAVEFLKCQLNAGASASDESVDLRVITFVANLDYKPVEFEITIGGNTAIVYSETVYESINVNGVAMSCADIFGSEGYLVTYTITGIPASMYNTEIDLYATITPTENNTVESTPWNTGIRTIVLADILG